MKKNRKRRHFDNRKKRIAIANAFFALILFLGVGYSVLDANLNVIGNILLKKIIVTAENLSYDNTNTGVECTTAQCMIDNINTVLDGNKG